MDFDGAAPEHKQGAGLGRSHASRNRGVDERTAVRLAWVGPVDAHVLTTKSLSARSGSLITACTVEPSDGVFWASAPTAASPGEAAAVAPASTNETTLAGEQVCRP